MTEHPQFSRLAMLVDDDPFFLRLMEHQLSTLGVELTMSCSSGAAAFDHLATLDTSTIILFLDLNMPDMDGVEFIRKLAATGYAGCLVMVSGEDARILETVVLLARAHQLRVIDHLTKPVQLERLSRIISESESIGCSSGRNRGRDYSRSELESAIRNGHLINHYQPQVEVATARVIGVEALVRWNHPEHGIVYPDSFIAVAEQHQMIDMVTLCVLARALEQLARWRASGLELRMSVNVSTSNLSSVDFTDTIVLELGRHGIPPTDLILELTESQLLSDSTAPLDILSRLRLRRVGLAIDDFGTGHSSLAKLRDLPFDELKIDRGFVHGASLDNTRRSIFSASIEMARHLGIQTVAEGVENESDWQFVRDQGCQLAQGYFISRPMAGDEIPAWIEEWNKRASALTGTPPVR